MNLERYIDSSLRVIVSVAVQRQAPVEILSAATLEQRL
jgi:hypothetical protein